MSNIDRKKKEIAFEVFESDENSVVFKRVVPDKGRKAKEVQEIELNLPKATMHLFNQDDIARLKIIEKELMRQIELVQPNKSWYDFVYKLFDVK